MPWIVSIIQIAMLFPFQIWTGYAHPITLYCKWIFHFGNIYILLPVYVSFPTGPDHIKFSPVFKNISVDSPFICRVGNLAFENPFTLHWIRRSIFQYIHPVVFILTIIGGKIYVPLISQKQDFGCP